LPSAKSITFQAIFSSCAVSSPPRHSSPVVLTVAARMYDGIRFTCHIWAAVSSIVAEPPRSEFQRLRRRACSSSGAQPNVSLFIDGGCCRSPPHRLPPLAGPSPPLAARSTLAHPYRPKRANGPGIGYDAPARTKSGVRHLQLSKAGRHLDDRRCLGNGGAGADRRRSPSGPRPTAGISRTAVDEQRLRRPAEVTPIAPARSPASPRSEVPTPASQALKPAACVEARG
jgi:hypothetical protein